MAQVVGVGSPGALVSDGSNECSELWPTLLLGATAAALPKPLRRVAQVVRRVARCELRECLVSSSRCRGCVEVRSMLSRLKARADVAGVVLVILEPR